MKFILEGAQTKIEEIQNDKSTMFRHFLLQQLILTDYLKESDFLAQEQPWQSRWNQFLMNQKQSIFIFNGERLTDLKYNGYKMYLQRTYPQLKTLICALSSGLVLTFIVEKMQEIFPITISNIESRMVIHFWDKRFDQKRSTQQEPTLTVTKEVQIQTQTNPNFCIVSIKFQARLFKTPCPYFSYTMKKIKK
tara:strand:- start:128 stop:703 length:576 start_codon:yes stop_codon:yes gene_type:complete